MSKHAVYLSSILVLLMAVAHAPAQDHVWMVNNLGNDGTSPNQGRMNEWCPPPVWSPTPFPWVHATWVNDSKAWYSHSPDEGLTWDDPPVAVRSNHPYSFWPALRALPDGSAWVCKVASDPDPCHWECAVTPPSTWTLSNVPHSAEHMPKMFPVATAVSTTDKTPMVYMATTIWVPLEQQYHLFFCAFDTATPQAIVRYWTYLESSAEEFDFQPSIDYTPGDKVHVVYRTPDGHIRENAWVFWYTPYQIRHDTFPIWEPIPNAYHVSVWGSTQEPGSHPFIDMYGDHGYCVWRGYNENNQDTGEIYRATLFTNDLSHLWYDHRNVTNSPDFESDYPQCYTSSTIIWQESMPGPANNTEIYAEVAGGTHCISNAQGFKNRWPQASVKNPVLSIPPPPPIFRCHALWSQDVIGGSTEQIHYRRCDFLPPAFAGVEYPTYLNSILGQAKASPYCLERDGYVDYGNFQVDYGKSRLVYDLPYLDPAHDYLAQFTLFNGESLPVTQSVRLGSVVVAEKTLRPGICETLLAYIPRAAYKNTHARLEVTRLSGPFACLAKDIRIYETYRTREHDGALAQTGPVAERGLHARPSLFSSRTIITLDGASLGNVFGIYDASGRLVRSLRAESRSGQGCSAVWDGADRDGRPLPAGQYTCTCATGSTATLVKVIRR